LSWSERRAAAVLALPVLVYAWMTAGLRPFTLPALAATLGGGLGAIAVGASLPRRSTLREGAATSGGWGWAALAGAIALWELQSFLQHPRDDHPTISSLTNSLLHSQQSRMVALLVWLAAGVWLARR
jgi:hypothetical protein